MALEVLKRWRLGLCLPWQRKLAWGLGVLGVGLVLAWLAAPYALRHLIESQGSQALGRKVSVEAVDFKPWSLELTLGNLQVAKADGHGAQFSIQRLVANAEIESVWRMAPVLDSLTIEAPRAHITHHGDGRYDFDDILQTLQARDKAQPPEPKPATEAAAFALYNLRIEGGELDFADEFLLPIGTRHHKLRSLQLAVPFISTLPAEREIKVLPQLAFDLNGSHFDSSAQATPFAPSKNADARIQIKQLDLAPYLPYLPATLPVKLQSAVLDTDLTLQFQAASTPNTAHGMVVAGTFKISQLALVDKATGAQIKVAGVALDVKAIKPVEHSIQLNSLAIDTPAVQLSHAAINEGAAHAVPTSATPQNAAPQNAASKASPWTVALERLTLQHGTVQWSDDAPRAQLELGQLEVQLDAVQWPLHASNPTRLAASASLAAPNTSVARLALTGHASLGEAQLRAKISDAAASLGAPYLADFLNPAAVASVQGSVDTELEATWSKGLLGGELPDIAVQSLALRDFALKPAREAAATANNAERAAADLPRFGALEISDASVQLRARTATVRKITLKKPSAMAHRDALGQWAFAQWFKLPAAPAAPPSSSSEAQPVPPTPSASAPAQKPWQLALGELLVDDASLRLDDRSTGAASTSSQRPVRVELENFKLQLKNANLVGDKPMPLSVATRVKSGRTEPGTLRFDGNVAWAPVAVQGSVDADDLPLHAFAPYLANQLKISVLRADASYKGQVRYAASAAGTELDVQGDATLSDFRANTANASNAQVASNASGELEVAEELLSWKTLQLPGIALRMEPGKPMQFALQEAVLSDFYARVILQEDGQLNLKNIVSQPVAPADTAQAAPKNEAPAAQIKLGGIRLGNGKVLFSDRFIRPNYSANLSELQGQLSAFSSQAPEDGAVQLADLELRGRAEGTASLEITGKVNPLAKPLAMNIQGKVRDLDLPPLTAYSVKYAGYGIDRGKLSMNVTYSVTPDGQLIASNQLILNQLSFGDKVESAPNSLPVKLAVALLADRHGVIDLNLPISGSLNDPQFQISSVIWKVLGNLITKALTAPFSLLASAFGGGDSSEDLSAIAFAPGSAQLTPQNTQALEKIAKALADRPGLNITVTGEANSSSEQEALRHERLKALMLAEKRRRAVVTGQDAATVTDLTAAEYPTLLRDVYRRADIKKPRNWVGLEKDMPQADMEATLLASIAVTPDHIQELALRRGVVVKDYLFGQKIGAERVFLGAPKTQMDESGWQPNAKLSVSSR